MMDNHLIPPIEFQVALDHVFRCVRGTIGRVDACAIGVKQLTDELAHYAEVRTADTTLVALGADQSTINDMLVGTPFRHVVTLTSGTLSLLLRRFQIEPIILPRDLPSSWWRSHGFVRVQQTGVFGPGAIGFALTERLARRCNRPELADRFRILMQRSLTTAATSGTVSLLSVRTYRKFD